MFHITRPVSAGAPPATPGVRKQTAPAKPTHEPHFGMKTVSFGQATHKVSPVTPSPAQPKTQGTRLDYYA